MKNWVRVLALSLALMMVLGVSAAFADAYTIPKTLKNVEGLPENPEVPELKTINDGKTETVTVVSGQLVSLSANWNNELVPLTLSDGSVSFDITGQIVQLGMEGKTATWRGGRESIPSGKYHYDYEVKKNDDGTFTVTEETWDQGYRAYPYTATLEYPKDSVTEKGTFTGLFGRTYSYQAFKTPYAEVTKPYYYAAVPTSAKTEKKVYVVPYTYPDEKTGKYIQVRDSATGKVIKFDENGDYYVVEGTQSEYDYDLKEIDSMNKDAAIEAALDKEVLAGMLANGWDPEIDKPSYYWGYSKGSVEGMYDVTRIVFWAEDIGGYGKAFEGKTADGWTVGYNRKGAACEKSIEMTGVDFFQSETAPSKVTVTWQSGKNMYNKTVWYVSKIAQEYSNEIVTASFAQGGQWNGIKKEAK